VPAVLIASGGLYGLISPWSQLFPLWPVLHAALSLNPPQTVAAAMAGEAAVVLTILPGWPRM
jgi:membrane associated rhomboid family serine protease